MAIEKKKPIKVYSYIRVSTAMQVEGFSIEAQREELKRYANNNNMIIVKEYSDEGVSGKNITYRKGFQKMMSEIVSNKDGIRYVITYELSRFGRNAADVINCVQDMQDNGVDLITLKPAVNSSDEFGKLMISVMSSIAEMEKETIRTHTKNGRIQKAREGKWNGAQAPYGYYLDKGALKINEKEAEVIRLIFDLYVNEDMGAVSIVNRLKNLGIKKVIRQNCKSDNFNATFIRRVLENPVYKGYIAFGRRKQEKIEGVREEYRTVKETNPDNILINKGIHEAIIPEELWERAHDKKIAKGGRKEKVRGEHEYLLSGLVKCPYCGKSMYGIHSKHVNKYGETKFYYAYKCRQKNLGTGHDCPSTSQFNCREVDEELEKFLVWQLRGTEFINEIAKQSNKEFDVQELKKQIEDFKDNLRVLEIKYGKLEDEQDKLDVKDDSYDFMFERYSKRMRDLVPQILDAKALLKATEEKLIDVNRRREEWQSSSRILLDLMSKYGSFTYAEKKKLVNRIIKSVEVFPEKRAFGYLKSVEFAFPVFKNDDKTKSTEFTIWDAYPRMLDENGEFNDIDPSDEEGGIFIEPETDEDGNVVVYPDMSDYVKEHGCLPPENMQSRYSLEAVKYWKEHVEKLKEHSHRKETTDECVALLSRV